MNEGDRKDFGPFEALVLFDGTAGVGGAQGLFYKVAGYELCGFILDYVSGGTGVTLSFEEGSYLSGSRVPAPIQANMGGVVGKINQTVVGPLRYPFIDADGPPGPPGLAGVTTTPYPIAAFGEVRASLFGIGGDVIVRASLCLTRIAR